MQTCQPDGWPLARIQEVTLGARERAEKIRAVHPVTASVFDELSSRVPFQDVNHADRYH